MLDIAFNFIKEHQISDEKIGQNLIDSFKFYGKKKFWRDLLSILYFLLMLDFNYDDPKEIF